MNSEATWNSFERCTTLVELLQQRAIDDPTRCAVVFLEKGEAETHSMTYGELDCRARAIAARLSHQVAEGTPVLLLYPSGLEFIAAFFGCLYAGVIAVPACPPRSGRRSTVRIESIVADSGAKSALTDSDTLSRIQPMLDGNVAITWIVTDTIENSAVAWSQPSINGETVAMLQYTSGSTAQPKGVVITHRGLLHNSEMIRIAFEFVSDDTVVGWLPMFHDMGLIGNVLQTIFVGCRLVLMPPEAFFLKPIRWLSAISHYQARVSGAPNFAYELCVQRIKPEQMATLELSGWKLAFTGAEPIRAETLDRFCDAFARCGYRREAFFPCYGLAEATLFVTGGQVSQLPVTRSFSADELAEERVVPVADDSDDARTLVGCGHTWNGQQTIIVDRKTSRPCVPDRIGEICLKGPSITLGYWNQPEATAHTFQFALANTGDGPFLRTGDLGFIHEGDLFITGRSQGLIIVHGRNHFAEDIERTVEHAHPSICPQGVAAFGVEVDCEERPVVVVEVERRFLSDARKMNIPTDESLRVVSGAIRIAVTQAHDLSLHAVHFVQRASIPKTSSGKIQRMACKTLFLSSTGQTIDEDPGSIEKVT